MPNVCLQTNGLRLFCIEVLGDIYIFEFCVPGCNFNIFWCLRACSNFLDCRKILISFRYEICSLSVSIADFICIEMFARDWFVQVRPSSNLLSLFVPLIFVFICEYFSDCSLGEIEVQSWGTYALI